MSTEAENPKPAPKDAQPADPANPANAPAEEQKPITGDAISNYELLLNPKNADDKKAAKAFFKKAYEYFKNDAENAALVNPLGTFTLKTAAQIKNIAVDANYTAYMELDDAAKTALDEVMNKLVDALDLTAAEKAENEQGAQKVRAAMGVVARFENEAEAEAPKAEEAKAGATAIAPAAVATAATPAERKERDKTQLEKVSQKNTVYVGDSLTVGMKDSLKEAGKNLAEGGIQTGKMLLNFREFIEEKKAGQHKDITRVVVLGGVNDIASQKKVTDITKNLATIYKLAHENGMTVVAVTMHNWDTEAFRKRHPDHPLSAEELTRRTKELNEWIRAQEGTPNGPEKVVDLNAAVEVAQKKGKQVLSPNDGLHFAGSGPKFAANFINNEGNIG